MMGRLVLVTCLDFTMNSLEKVVLDEQRIRTVKSLYPDVKPLRKYLLNSLHRAYDKWPTRPSPDDRTP